MCRTMKQRHCILYSYIVCFMVFCVLPVCIFNYEFLSIYSSKTSVYSCVNYHNRADKAKKTSMRNFSSSVKAGKCKCNSTFAVARSRYWVSMAALSTRVKGEAFILTFSFSSPNDCNLLRSQDTT